MAIDKRKLLHFVNEDMARAKVLVVGDVMLDRYYYGDVTRISPEAPVPVNHVTSVKDTLGGAANVAQNLARLGCKTYIAGFVGSDHHCESLIDQFVENKINYNGIIYRDKPTTAKLRIIGGHQQMLRLDFEDTEPVEECYAERLISYVDSRLVSGLDAIILSDYGKGCCTDGVCSSVIELAAQFNVPVFVDPKGYEWDKYMWADYITPNLKELNAVLEKPVRNKDEAIEQGARYVMHKFKIRSVLATRSEHGMSLVEPEGVDHIPTKAREVFDVSGAGDTVISVFALGIAGGLEPKEAAHLSNLAAGVVVGKLGTYALKKRELEHAILLQIKEEKERVEKAARKKQ